MARIVFVTWYGGGNLAPALGIGSELGRRGHSVSVFGQTPQRRAVEAAGMAFTPTLPSRTARRERRPSASSG